ncbi:hypothetical protein EDB89DRAFT_1912457 [Lactarius sanguifluus]|nr:hypothetical protein EDB89DRAFT_1912457 [Lactarius sanguifluus]
MSGPVNTYYTWAFWSGNDKALADVKEREVHKSVQHYNRLSEKLWGARHGVSTSDIFADWIHPSVACSGREGETEHQGNNLPKAHYVVHQVLGTENVLRVTPWPGALITLGAILGLDRKRKRDLSPLGKPPIKPAKGLGAHPAGARTMVLAEKTRNEVQAIPTSSGPSKKNASAATLSRGTKRHTTRDQCGRGDREEKASTEWNPHRRGTHVPSAVIVEHGGSVSTVKLVAMEGDTPELNYDGDMAAEVGSDHVPESHVAINVSCARRGLRAIIPFAEITPVALLDFVYAPHTAVDRTCPINARNVWLCLATTVAFLRFDVERTPGSFILEVRVRSDGPVGAAYRDGNERSAVTLRCARSFDGLAAGPLRFSESRFAHPGSKRGAAQPVGNVSEISWRDGDGEPKA